MHNTEIKRRQKINDQSYPSIMYPHKTQIQARQIVQLNILTEFHMKLINGRPHTELFTDMHLSFTEH